MQRERSHYTAEGHDLPAGTVRGSSGTCTLGRQQQVVGFQLAIAGSEFAEQTSKRMGLLGHGHTIRLTMNGGEAIVEVDVG